MVTPCQDCPLHESALFSNCLAGRGPSDARVMLVGQGPGGTEDVARSVFVGRSGKLLDAMLADAGYSLGDLFFTNATRCRPPMVGKSERAPTPAEVDACRKYLIEEVHRVKPEVIIALGDVALRSLCKTSGIKGKRGQELPLHKDFAFAASVYPTYHPAAVLRVPTLRRTVVADLRKVRDRTLEAEKIEWEWWSGQPLPSDQLIAFDIETFDAEGAITPLPTQMSVVFGDKCYVTKSPDDVVLLARELMGKRAVGHFSWDFDCEKLNGLLQSVHE